MNSGESLSLPRLLKAKSLMFGFSVFSFAHPQTSRSGKPGREEWTGRENEKSQSGLSEEETQGSKRLKEENGMQ